MYNSQYYTCEQIDQRLLQGYVDDYNQIHNTELTKAQFLNLLATHLNNGLTTTDIVQESGNNINKIIETTTVIATLRLFKIRKILSLLNSLNSINFIFFLFWFSQKLLLNLYH